MIGAQLPCIFPGIYGGGWLEPSPKLFPGDLREGCRALRIFPGIYGKGVAARAFEVSRCQESYPHEVSGKSTRIQVRACFIDFCALRSAGQSSAEHILGRGRVQRGLLGRRPRSSASAPDPGHGRPWVVPLTSHEHNISSLRRHAGTTESSTETPVGQKPDPLQILCRPSVEWLKSRCPGS